jgi:hypothetical protein
MSGPTLQSPSEACGASALVDAIAPDANPLLCPPHRKGTLVTLGNASGPAPAFSPLKLGPKNLKGASSSCPLIFDRNADFRPVLPSFFLSRPVNSSLSLHLHGPPPPVARPVLNQYVHTRDEFQSYSTELFQLIKDGVLNLAVHGEYPLTTEGVRQTQKDISAFLSRESRRGFASISRRNGSRRSCPRVCEPR